MPDHLSNGDTNNHTNSNSNGQNGLNDHASGSDSNRVSGAAHFDLDAVVVGAGFAGIYLLHQLRKEGLRVKIVEAGHGLGGVWYWNSYPGARTDTPVPAYSLNIPEVFETWKWTEEHPGHEELKAYFRHIDSVLDISRDVVYGERLTTATFNEAIGKWQLESDQGTTFTAQFFCPCLGFASKAYFPDWPGLQNNFQGRILHPNLWPSEDIDLREKKVVVVGTGATGIQIAQEVSRDAKQLTCFVRTPNLSWPLIRRIISPEQTLKERPLLKYWLGEKRFTNVGGWLYDLTTRGVMDDTPEEREARLEADYREGGLKWCFCSYNNILGTQEGNDEVYKFWRRKTHERMADKEKAELLAPLKPPHPFAGKRTALEQDYYEQMDKPNVTLVDVKSNPVVKAVSNGLVTADGTVHEADIIILATGYDAVTGGLRQISITGLNGLSLEEKWKDATHSYLGLMISGMPNMFYTYGPLSPTAYATGPAIGELQAHWIIDTMRKMREQGLARIDATVDGERKWREKVDTIHAYTLREHVEGSWYLGLNVPGKRREVLIYSGGLPMYKMEIMDAIVPDWKGFTVI
ncbi:hypothetical protein HYALB_00010874 [Hymenoscyphus albidus]|uniref:FAD/NAD(P)-binding domain-containing protein n=1 Tax=Hymenoscyphus albidus TaxID=595503 RepID=A0A9N9Q7B3_9HELO|nr:hypothetical protein HYALB_00010874 [Hymenoscyphus albidus]